ncbi:uncharacterized protein LOC132204324 [Neocloeon triangulifer]|uniref:uncharacterized protein LOC132204324 n=1 Tax=Neocloeon triangulifer TaxID=2078957 RepID=UPI00286F0173|nr:uncharacterized protein LOC132204324 [Neocloeon triangulifer]
MAEGTSERKVDLVFDDNSVVTAEVKFLCEISLFFDAMLRGNFKEANSDSIKLKGFCTKSVTLFLTAAMKSKLDLYFAVHIIMSPKIFQTLKMLMVKVDLEEIAMITMTQRNISKYRKIAADTGNNILEEKCLRKAVGIFSEFRKTRQFKRMKIETIKKMLNRRYLDCNSETEVLKAAMGWLNFDMQGREGQMEAALSLVDWHKIKTNQFRFLISKSKIVKKSWKLKHLISMTFFNLKGKYSPSDKLFEDVSKILSARKQMEKQPLFFMVQTEVKISKKTFSLLFFYDVENERFTDTMVSVQKDQMNFEHDFDIYDFQVYMFGRVKNGERKGLIRKRPVYLPLRWKNVGRYEARLASTRPVENRRSVEVNQMREHKHSLRQEEEEFAPERLPDNPVEVQRSGRNFYIFHVGCEQFDTKDRSVRTLWEKDDGCTYCVKSPFIYSAFREGSRHLEFYEYDLKKFSLENHLKSDLRRMARRVNAPPPPLVLLSPGLSFLTPIKKNLYISEKMFDSFNDPKKISRTRFLLKDNLKRTELPIVYQFSFRNVLHFLLNENTNNEADKRSFGLYKFLGTAGHGVEKIKSLPDMAVQMKQLLAKHFSLLEHEFDLATSMKFKLVNPVWFEGIDYKKRIGISPSTSDR